MRSSLNMLILAALLLSGTARGAESTRSVEMTVGEQRVFDVPGTTKVTTCGGGVAVVRPTGESQFLILAQKPGRCSFLVFRRGRATENWLVEVRSDAVERFNASCVELLGPDGCADLQVASAGGRLVLSGRIRDMETYHRVQKLKRAFPDLVLLAEVEPVVLDALVRAINEEFAKAKLRGVKVTRFGSRLFLEGTVADELERRKVEAIVKALAGETLGTD